MVKLWYHTKRMDKLAVCCFLNAINAKRIPSTHDSN